MKPEYKFFKRYLPVNFSSRYSGNPIIYIKNYYKEEIYSVYSFDPIKNVLLVSDINKEIFRYMSLYEFEEDGWKIITDYEYDI